MKTGAIIFAQNSEKIDYVQLAIFAAARIKQYLDVPVSIVTDSKGWLLSEYPDHPFDTIIDIIDTGVNPRTLRDGALTSMKVNWKNLSRSSVYGLTPYDRTLVIDSDYIINSSILKSALANQHEFQIYKNSFDLAGWRDNSTFTRINQFTIPFYWATTFIFQKCEMTETFFTLVAYIKGNWNYFRNLYYIDSALFRNDYAFSIAIHIMNGSTNGTFETPLPGTMTYVLDTDLLVDIKGDAMQFLVEKQGHVGEYLLAKTTNIDVHVMNKLSLTRVINGGLGV